jgi:hypothetical protein
MTTRSFHDLAYRSVPYEGDSASDLGLRCGVVVL